jgi:hypothetical protein
VRHPAEGSVRDDADDPSPLDDQDMDRAAHRLSLTIMGKEVEENRKAVAEYGASDSGASLGDILNAPIRGGIRPPLKSKVGPAGRGGASTIYLERGWAVGAVIPLGLAVERWIAAAALSEIFNRMSCFRGGSWASGSQCKPGLGRCGRCMTTSATKSPKPKQKPKAG